MSAVATCEITSVSFRRLKLAFRGALITGSSSISLSKTFLACFRLFKVQAIQLDLAGLTSIDEVGIALLGKLSVAASRGRIRLDLIHAPEHLESVIAAIAASETKEIR
jgi:ABC-type transporter Mla MlaB component